MTKESKTIVLDAINRYKADIFFSKYKPKFNFNTDIERKYYLGENQKKVCRFCGRAKPNTRFKKDAHVIPQLLGNHKLLSNFECDRCNDLFSIFEDSLASFFGPFRTITKITGKKGTNIPTFKEPNSKMVIRKSNIPDVDTEIINYDNNVSIKESKNSIIIKCKRNPFIPIRVYKILMKIGLCLINEKQVDEYEKAFSFLRKVKQNKQIKLKTTLVNLYIVPGSPLTIKPYVELWERIETEEFINVVKHCIVIYLPNLVFQIFLPYNSIDLLKQAEGEHLEMPPIPLLYDHNKLSEKFNYYKFETIDLSSPKTQKYEPEI
jgi:hypothetical protein